MLSLRALAFVSVCSSLTAAPAFAADMMTTMERATPSGPGESVGTVTVSTGASGSQFVVDLHGLSPGMHGFHVHENGSCAPSANNGPIVPAGGAGGHLDPNHTSHHEGPEREGHLGDLPLLTVEADGSAKAILQAPRLKDAAVLSGRALMIHAGGDNYSDSPQPLGGGGARIACGVLR